MEKEKNDNGTKDAMSLHLSGDIYLIRGEYDKALEYYQKSLADTEKKCDMASSAILDAYQKHLKELYGK